MINIIEHAYYNLYIPSNLTHSGAINKVRPIFPLLI